MPSSKNVSTMSSETSTERIRVRAESSGNQPRRDRPKDTQETPSSALEPWQFFVLAALGCATAALFATRGQSVTAIVLLTVLMATTALVAIGVLRMLRPLVSSDGDQTPMVGGRTRAAMEREKMLALRAIKELEFDRAMGKLSDADWQEMSGRLRARAARLIRQLDDGAGYRDRIEQDLAKRLGPVSASVAAGVCGSCGTKNDGDARFCKSCGQKL